VRKDVRSGCPVNVSLEIFGDRWTLPVLRDIIFAGARPFRELLSGPERIYELRETHLGRQGRRQPTPNGPTVATQNAGDLDAEPA
jgi:hypothetical protein